MLQWSWFHFMKLASLFSTFVGHQFHFFPNPEMS